MGFVFAVALMSGCTTQQKLDRDIALCPDYMQRHGGKGHVLGLPSVLMVPFGGPVGWQNKKDPNGGFFLTPLAVRKHRLEEIFHGFDHRCVMNRWYEWNRFRYEYCQGKPTPKPNMAIALLCILMPGIEYMPVPGHVNLYACSFSQEDAAACFVFWITGGKRDDPELMRKVGIVADYVQGKFRVENDVSLVERYKVANYYELMAMVKNGNIPPLPKRPLD